MRNTAIKILRGLEENGELSLEDISKLIPSKFGDHRDYYVFASLVATGYVDDESLPDPNDSYARNKKESLLAREYYACCGAEITASFRNLSWTKAGGGNLKDQPFTLTGKGSLFLSEYRSKRFERLFSLGTGIFVGIIVAVVGAYVRAELSSL